MALPAVLLKAQNAIKTAAKARAAKKALEDPKETLKSKLKRPAIRVLMICGGSALFVTLLISTVAYGQTMYSIGDVPGGGSSSSSSGAASGYLQWAIDKANDDSYGYSQGYYCSGQSTGPNSCNDGSCGSFDCQGLVKAALQNNGYNVSWNWTGDMAQGLTAAGFSQHTYNSSELQPGDILLVHNSSLQHTAIYVGDGQIVEALNDENGGICSGRAGDNNGREVMVDPNWADGKWQYYFRAP